MADNGGNGGAHGATSWNHGTQTTKKGRFTYLQSYGKDDSNWTGSASDERGNTGQGGSVTDVGHSLTGTSANQKGAAGGEE